MAREHPSYRDQLEDILTFFQGKRVLTMKDVLLYTSRSREWCKAYLDISKGGVSACVLARKLVDL